MKTPVLCNFLPWALLALMLTSCGGGTGGTGSGGDTPTSGVSIGVMAKGSVIVNGVRFEDTTANIFIDDTPKTAANLQSGMVVKVLGTVNDDGINGTAQEVRAQIEVRGLVTSKNALVNLQSFVVFGQTVIVDDLTVYSNISFNAIVANSTIVEVHGLRDATGSIRASRVEGSLTALPDGTGMANPLVDEIRGVVSNGSGGVTNPTTFFLGTQEVTRVAGATIEGGSYSNGSIVEAHCTARPNCLIGNVFQASRIEVEDFSNLPGNGQRFEVEGIVSGLTVPIPARAPSDPPPALSFKVAGVLVTTSGSTRFVGGIYEDMNNNIKVEAEGTWNGSALVARKIEFKRSVIRLQGVVTTSTAPSFTLTITGAGAVTVEADSLTSGDFANGAVPTVDPNACVQVRGQRKAGGGVVVTAGEIRGSCSSSNDHLIQAPVEVESGTTLTLLGFAINVGSPTDNPPYRNIDDSPMTATDFFNAVVPANPGPPSVAGTLVKVRFNTPQTTVKQVELED